MKQKHSFKTMQLCYNPLAFDTYMLFMFFENVKLLKRRGGKQKEDIEVREWAKKEYYCLVLQFQTWTHA